MLGDAHSKTYQKESRMNESLRQITVRIRPAVYQAVEEGARKAGQEFGDFAADLLAQSVIHELRQMNPDEADRLEAQWDVKKEALAFAVDETRRNGWDPHITLRTFQHIRNNPQLSKRFSKAIGNRPGDDRGNWLKANFNRALGSAIKVAVGGVAQTVGGNRVKVEVLNEYIRTYTPLDPDPARQ
jgi:hypothetical protein